MSDFDDLTKRREDRHSKRVTAFTIAIARALGVPREQILVMARGAFLHDIGKMAIPDRILRKSGMLDDDEMAVMRQHCVHGYQMLKRIPFLAEACETVLSHHERYDGSGYPQGLKGKEIPLGARIVAVANSLDAIISDLPYRRARSLAEARAEIQTSAGCQFDPEVVEVFLKMPNDIFEDLRKNVDGYIVPSE
jgi:putative nucleotidyltransferase with HDIG domain